MTYTIAPVSANYGITNVVVDGVSLGQLSSYTFQSVSGDHTIDAVFTAGPLNCQPQPPFTFDASDPSLGAVGMMVPGYATGQRGPFTRMARPASRSPTRLPTKSLRIIR